MIVHGHGTFIDRGQKGSIESIIAVASKAVALSSDPLGQVHVRGVAIQAHDKIASSTIRGRSHPGLLVGLMLKPIPLAHGRQPALAVLVQL